MELLLRKDNIAGKAICGQDICLVHGSRGYRGFLNFLWNCLWEMRRHNLYAQQMSAAQ